MVGEVDVVDSGAVRHPEQVTAAREAPAGEVGRRGHRREGEAGEAREPLDEERRRHADLVGPDGDDHRAHRRPRVRADAEEGEGRRPGPLREQLGGAAHRDVQRRSSPRSSTRERRRRRTPRRVRRRRRSTPPRLFNTGTPAAEGAEPAPTQPPPPAAVRSYTYVVPAAGTSPYYCILHTRADHGRKLTFR